jgi:hypothetical protein
MHHDLTVLVQNTDIHGAGVQVDAAGPFMLPGVESHEVSSSLVSLPNASIPPRYAEEGASIEFIPINLQGIEKSSET